MMGAPGNGCGLVVTFAELVGDPSLGARLIEVGAGTAFHEPASSARNVYFIQTGQVRVYQVGPGAEPAVRLLEILGPGDWFGVAALTRAPEYGTRAVAMTGCTVSEIPAEKLLAARQPALAAELVAQLADKLQKAYRDAACLVFDDCNSRLIKTLVQFSRSAAASPREDGVVLRITHQQLAQAVGAARETISLALTQLRQQNLLRTGRNQLFFNPEVLEQFSRNSPPPSRPRADRNGHAPAGEHVNGFADAERDAAEAADAHEVHEQVA